MRIARGVLLVVLLAVFGLGMVWQEMRLLEVRRERARLEAEQRRGEAERLVLRSRIEGLTTPGRTFARMRRLGSSLSPVERRVSASRDGRFPSPFTP